MTASGSLNGASHAGSTSANDHNLHGSHLPFLQADFKRTTCKAVLPHVLQVAMFDLCS